MSEILETTEQDERVYTLKRPVPDLPESFVFDLEELTAMDIIKAEKEYNRALAKDGSVNSSMVKELSKEYLAFIVAKAIKWKIEDVYRLGAHDFTNLTTRASYFLLRR